MRPPAPAGDGLLLPDQAGPEVRALQERLDRLGFWPGRADGCFGPGTTHAVTAFQKAAGLIRDGVAGPATRAALDTAGRVRTASTTGHVVEVDLGRQLVIVADDGRATVVLDATTGAVAGSTPVGRFRVQRRVDGFAYGPHGPLYRPAYFTGGVALHGYPSVPATPSSHGSVRITGPAIDQLWTSGALPAGAAVWVY
jgi:peptidoglycan hydrolase-like protein with peptidoglycan-binding domain